ETTQPEPTSTIQPMEEITSAIQAQHIPQCDLPPAAVFDACGAPSITSTSLSLGDDELKREQVRMVEVGLNLTLGSREAERLGWSIELLLEVPSTSTSQRSSL